MWVLDLSKPSQYIPYPLTVEFFACEGLNTLYVAVTCYLWSCDHKRLFLTGVTEVAYYHNNDVFSKALGVLVMDCLQAHTHVIACAFCFMSTGFSMLKNDSSYKGSDY